MSQPTQPFADDLDFAMAEVGETLTYGGDEYDCIRTTVTKGATLAMEGVYVDAAVSFTCRAADFGTPPVSGQTVEHDGTTYRIIRTAAARHGVAFRLDCEELTA